MKNEQNNNYLFLNRDGNKLADDSILYDFFESTNEFNNFLNMTLLDMRHMFITKLFGLETNDNFDKIIIL